METEELCSVNISPLVTNTFATQWSPDNQISIITERGVHILQLEPSPMSPNPAFKFARSFIYPSDTFPACAFTDEMNSLIWNLMHEDIYSLFMNDDVTPKLDGATDKFSMIAKTAWSPKNLISPNQCVLAILSSAGAVELLHKVFNNWYSICDVSSLRLKMIQDEIKISLDISKFHMKSSNQSTRIAESIRKLQACSVTWSELFKIEETSFAYFSVAYCSGDILIWKVPRISNFTKSLEPVIFGTIYLNDALKANVLCWITINVNEHLIVVGYFDGRIRGIKLMDKDNNLQVASIERYVEPDHIAINYLYIISQDKADIKILAAKGSFLLLLCLNLTGELKGMQHLRVQKFTITGIIPIVAEQFLITTQNGHIFVADTQLNKLVTVSIQSHLPQTHVQYLGLACSPNKVIFASITSPNTIYDHLVTREPSIIHIFTLRGAICDPLSIIDNSANLGSIWDCMEVLRLKATKGNPSEIFSSIPRELESLSLCKLQISLWMTVIRNVCMTKKSIPNVDYIKECKLTKELSLIFLHSTCAYLENSIKKNILSEDEMSAASQLRRYLEIYQSGDEEKEEDTNVNRRIRRILNMTTSYPTQIEKCNLCDKVTDGMWYARSCPQGHKLPRCCTTLLQITLFEYRVCPICNQIFHPCLEDMYEEPQCQYCDVPILRNLYDFDVENLELYERNVSLSQFVDITESSRDPELEESSDKQRRNKWNTSHTYSVIVNEDEDESSRITEKWEEF